MISVPDAGLLPSTPRPVLCMNGSITSCGKPCGYVGIAVAVTMPISSQWPVVVSLPLERSSSRPCDRRRTRLRRAALERHHVAEAERLERGQVEASDRAGDVAERVGALVSVLGRVGQLSRADGIQHDHARPRHCGYSRRVWRNPGDSADISPDPPRRAIVRREWTPSSVSSASPSTSALIISLASAVTWAVVKLSPSKSQKQLDAKNASTA